MMRKIASLIALALLISSISLCGLAETMVPGTYEDTANSVGGPLTVKVTVTEDRIDSIEIAECADTPGIGDAAVSRLIPMMIENQSTNVDVVSGATLTSIFLKNAVNAALQEAGAGKDDFNEPVKYAAEAQADQEADVVVVGGGLAGMSAATEAAGQGLKVILLEKLAYLGGDSLVSDQGVVNTLHEPVASAFPEAVASLMDKGIPIALADYPGYGENTTIAVEGTGDFDVLYTLVNHMRELAQRNGTVFMLDTPATDLIVEDGAVVGVTAQPRGQDSFSIRAKAVILCTGGFSTNGDLVKEYLPYADGARKMGLGSNTGDALEWIKAVDGKTVMLDAADSSFMMANPMTGAAASFGYDGNNYVNAEGEGIVDDRSYNLGAEAVYKAVGGEKVWNMYAASAAEGAGMLPFLEKSVHNLTAVYYENMEQVAEAYDMPKLVETLKGRGYDENEKWYVMQSVSNIYGTYGGIGVDMDSHVLNQNDEIIPGLYAAGEVIGSREYQQNGAYAGGLAPAFSIGFVAARTAAADMK